jgi:hypothetical protein
MIKPNALWLFFASQVGLLLPLPCSAERAESVAYAPMGGAAVRAMPAFAGSGSRTWALDLPTVNADLTPPGGGVVKSGVVLPLPAPVAASQLAWEPVAGGYAARVHVTSGQAKRLRFHLSFPGGPKPVRLLAQGNLDSSPAGPVDGSVIQGHGAWLPVTNGNEADLEIFAVENTRSQVLDVNLDAVNVIVADVSGGDIEGVVANSLSYAKQKEYDLACWSGDPAYQGLSQAAAATAKINFIQNGNSFVCSGTLLADRGATRTPWFATAHHCIADQATADTASFEWFFQATGCGSSARDARYAQTYGGALLLYTDFVLEPSLLKLNQPPPADVTFVGWDSGIYGGERVWAVHHPEGDHTMVSQGTVTDLLQKEIDISRGGSHLLDNVTFQAGGTEPGSSGSGLFSIANGSAYWMGTLFGGPVNNYQIASYSHLPSYYNSIKKWLENTSAAVVPSIGFFTASPVTVDYLTATTLAWSAANATACSATTSDGWAGAVGLSGSATLTLKQTTAYTLSCDGLVGKAMQALTVTVAPAPAKLSCLFDWAEKHYPGLFSPASVNQFADPYTYRHYRGTRSYVGVSSLNNHVYYLDPAGVLGDVGELGGWLTTSACW